MDSTTIAKLKQTLDPNLLRTRPGGNGKRLSYLEGAQAIKQANAIFGYGAWGYELVGEPTLRLVTWKDRQGKEQSAQTYSAVVRVTVDGVPPRTDIGFCAVRGMGPDAHDTAIKGAVTDGMKRGLRAFGAQFGNDLYTDSPAPKDVAGDPAEPASPPQSETRRRRLTITEKIDSLGAVIYDDWPARRPTIAQWASGEKEDDIGRLATYAAQQVLKLLQEKAAQSAE